MDTEPSKNETKSGLTADDCYVPKEKNSNCALRDLGVNPKLKFSHCVPSRMGDDSPFDTHKACDEDKEVSAFTPLILGVLAVAAAILSFFTLRLLLLASVILSIGAIIFGTKTKLTNGRMSVVGAVLGMLGLTLSVVSFFV